MSWFSLLSFRIFLPTKNPVVNLTLTGILRPFEEQYHFVKMIFEGENIPQKDENGLIHATLFIKLCKYRAFDKEQIQKEVSLAICKGNLILRRLFFCHGKTIFPVWME